MINRTLAPKIVLPSKINLLDIEKIQLKNGLKVHSIDGCSEPVINLTLILKAGNNYQGKDFVASFNAALLKKGTKSMTATQIAETLDFYGASLSVQSGMFTVQISLHCLASKLENILVILKELLTEAIFPEIEIERYKKKKLQELKINEGKTIYHASVCFNEAIFGKNHPSGYRPSAERIKSIQQKDILSYYNTTFQLNNESFIVLSGKIDQSTIKIIDKHLGSILINNIFKEKDNPLFPSKEKEIFIPVKDSVQSSIYIGQSTIGVFHEDYLDLEILNNVLGGYFGSRLMKKIREDKGYTYGIYSYLSSYSKGAYFCIATDVGVQYKDLTLNEISKEINRLKTEFVSEDELQMVKNYLKGKIMKGVDGSLNFANILKGNLSLGLNENRINEQLQAIEEISAKRLLILANKYLDFENMYKVVAG